MSAHAEAVQMAEPFRIVTPVSLARQTRGMHAVEMAELAQLFEAERRTAYALGAIEQLFEARQAAVGDAPRWSGTPLGDIARA